MKFGMVILCMGGSSFEEVNTSDTNREVSILYWAEAEQGVIAREQRESGKENGKGTGKRKDMERDEKRKGDSWFR